MPIDILSGGSRLRETLDAGGYNARDVAALAKGDAEQWWERERPYLLCS